MHTQQGYVFLPVAEKTVVTESVQGPNARLPPGAMVSSLLIYHMAPLFSTIPTTKENQLWLLFLSHSSRTSMVA